MPHHVTVPKERSKKKSGKNLILFDYFFNKPFTTIQVNAKIIPVQIRPTRVSSWTAREKEAIV